MSTNWNPIVDEPGAATPRGEIALRLEAVPEALDATGGSDGAGPSLERIVFDPGAAGDDEVGVTIEWHFDGVRVDSVTELSDDDDPLGEDTAIDRLAFDGQRGGDDEVGLLLHGRLEETDSAVTGENSPLERIIIEPLSE